MYNEQSLGPLQAHEFECREYHTQSFNSSQVCNFMQTTENCHTDDGFVDYLIFVFCSFSLDYTWLAVILLAVWLVVLFIALGTVADTFFCPSLRTIADSMKLSQNIAGVTFLAFGNGAPDVFSAIAAVGNSKGGDSGLAFGALFGAGVFVSTVIVGLICFIEPFYSVQRPFLRDVIFFLISAFWTFVVVWDGYIRLWETLGFLFLYVVYIFVVVIGRYVNQKIKLSQGIMIKNDFRARGLTGKSATLDSYNGEDDRSECEEDEEATQPLLTNSNREFDFSTTESTYSKSLSISCLPIDFNEWRESNLINRALLVVKIPVMYLLKLTIPLVDYDLPSNNWNKSTIMINCLLAPIFMVFATQNALIKLFGVQLWVYMIVLGVVLCALVYFLTDLNTPPRVHFLFAYLGFIVSIVWIYSVANEIVNLLTTFGVILNISNTILGLTFLAWGNSLSDLVANVASARRGFVNMSISACFGGPLFNILLGVGIPFTFQCIRDGEIMIKRSFLQDILALFVGISLVSSLIFVPLNKFYFSRRYGIYLIFLYAVFLVTCILIESKVIPDPFKKN